MRSDYNHEVLATEREPEGLADYRPGCSDSGTPVQVTAWHPSPERAADTPRPCHADDAAPSRLVCRVTPHSPTRGAYMTMLALFEDQ